MRGQVAGARGIRQGRHDAEDEDAIERNDGEGEHADSAGGAEVQLAGHGEESTDDDENGESKAGEAKGAVEGDTARGNEAVLHEEEQDPRGEDSRVELDDGVGQRRAKDSIEVIGGRKADDDDKEDKGRHAGEEETIIAAAGKARGHARGNLRSGGHSFSRQGSRMGPRGREGSASITTRVQRPIGARLPTQVTARLEAAHNSAPGPRRDVWGAHGSHLLPGWKGNLGRSGRLTFR